MPNPAAYRTLLALDFDDTLVMTSPHSVPVWDSFMAAWLVQHGHYASVAEARTNMQSYNNPYGCGPTFMAEQFGRNKAWIEGFYLAVSPLLLQANLSGGVSVNPGLKTEILRLWAAGYYPVIISQGHRDFLIPMLQHLGLSSLFAPTQIIDRAHKRLEPHGYQLAKYLTNYMPLQHYIIADDSAPNFPHAKAEGFTTVLIKPNPNADEQAAADNHFPDLVSYLKTLA
jgi:FMN phosphatase YigB (HAD superfamily)